LALRPVTVDSLPPEEPAPALAAVPSFADADLSGARDRVSEGVAPRSSSGSLAQGTASREPVLLTSGNGGLGKNLILPPVRYPREALVARLTGKVIIEFRTGASGEIADARVRASSGSSLLDRTALDNLKQGRWLGGPGFYLMKPYEFALEN
jgi:TonB family protein